MGSCRRAELGAPPTAGEMGQVGDVLAQPLDGMPAAGRRQEPLPSHSQAVSHFVGGVGLTEGESWKKWGCQGLLPLVLGLLFSGVRGWPVSLALVASLLPSACPGVGVKKASWTSAWLGGLLPLMSAWPRAVGSLGGQSALWAACCSQAHPRPSCCDAGRRCLGD